MPPVEHEEDRARCREPATRPAGINCGGAALGGRLTASGA